MSGLKRNRLFWFWLSNLHRTGDEVSHGSGALLQYQFRRPMNTPLSRGSQERGDPASPGQVEAGYGQAPRQTVSAAAAGAGLGTGENDPCMRYLNKQREEQARQQGATPQSTGNSSLSGGCVGQGLGQNGGCWQQGFVTQQSFEPRDFSNWSSRLRRISVSCFSELRSSTSRIGHGWCSGIRANGCSQRCFRINEPTGDAIVAA